MHQGLNFILFGATLYMFRTVFPPIIRSSRLYIQQWTYVKQTADCLLASTCTSKSIAKEINGEVEKLAFIRISGHKRFSECLRLANVKEF